ncbi:MAG: LamG domain-containing protein, partial [Acetatifactor sp.]|nr:LamG domain-containing protein [Acetatifactor sp.]
SYTICMWVRPLELTAWSSVLYVRYSDGFISLIPCSAERTCVYRMYQDGFTGDYHDVSVQRMIQKNKWTFLSVTYDAITRVGRLYLNGRLAGEAKEMPQLPASRQILLGGDPYQQPFKGYVSGLIFGDNVMTEMEVRDLYYDFCNDSGFAGEAEEF